MAGFELNTLRSPPSVRPLDTVSHGTAQHSVCRRNKRPFFIGSHPPPRTDLDRMQRLCHEENLA